MNGIKLIISILLISILLVSCQTNMINNESIETAGNNDSENNLNDGEILMSGHEIPIDEILVGHVNLFGVTLIDMEYNDNQVYKLSIEIWRDGFFASSVGSMNYIKGNEVGNISISAGQKDDDFYEFKLGVNSGGGMYSCKHVFDYKTNVYISHIGEEVQSYKDTENIYLWIMQLSDNEVNQNGSIYQQLMDSEYAAVVVLKPVNLYSNPTKN